MDRNQWNSASSLGLVSDHCVCVIRTKPLASAWSITSARQKWKHCIQYITQQHKASSSADRWFSMTFASCSQISCAGCWMSLPYGRVLPEIKHISDPQVWEYQNTGEGAGKASCTRSSKVRRQGQGAYDQLPDNDIVSSYHEVQGLISTWKITGQPWWNTVPLTHRTSRYVSAHWAVWDNTQPCSTWKNKAMK